MVPFRLGFVTGATPDKWARVFRERGGPIELVPVEDEPSIASLVRAYLERDSYKVVWASNGADALAAV